MKHISLKVRVVVYAGLAAALIYIIIPTTGSTAHGPSKEERERILTAYFDALYEKRVERPISTLEAATPGARYRDELYRPAVRIFVNTIRVQTSRGTFISYSIDRHRIFQGDGAYAFKEAGREAYDELGNSINPK